ncbi:hypothetical protein H8959_011624 [Pygathrix nigripes]
MQPADPALGVERTPREGSPALPTSAFWRASVWRWGLAVLRRLSIFNGYLHRNLTLQAAVLPMGLVTSVAPSFTALGLGRLVSSLTDGYRLDSPPPSLSSPTLSPAPWLIPSILCKPAPTQVRGSRLSTVGCPRNLRLHGLLTLDCKAGYEGRRTMDSSLVLIVPPWLHLLFFVAMNVRVPSGSVLSPLP